MTVQSDDGIIRDDLIGLYTSGDIPRSQSECEHTVELVLFAVYAFYVIFRCAFIPQKSPGLQQCTIEILISFPVIRAHFPLCQARKSRSNSVLRMKSLITEIAILRDDYERRKELRDVENPRNYSCHADAYLLPAG
ncbi:hypothetical protein CAJAP_03242 [Camponotus japonicus]